MNGHDIDNDSIHGYDVIVYIMATQCSWTQIPPVHYGLVCYINKGLRLG